MKASATLVALLGLLGCGRTAAKLETQTFELRYLQTDQAAGIIDPYVYGDRPGAKGRLSIAGNSLTVRETRDNLERIARVLAEYDKPRPELRLTFRVIEADGSVVTDPAIADVEAALRKLFRFRGYRLVGEGVVTASENNGVSQMIGGPAGVYRLDVTVHRVRGAGDSATVQMDVRLLDGLSTGLTIPLGKTAVVGSAQARTGKGTLILTVRPELVAN